MVQKDRKVVVTGSEGDPGRFINQMNSIIGGIKASPYEQRTFVILDSVHTPGTADKLERLGVPGQNIIRWSNNGIEHYYPPQILASIFRVPEADVKNINVVGDNISLNGIDHRKEALAKLVCQQLAPETVHSPEFVDKFLSPLSDALDAETTLRADPG